MYQLARPDSTSSTRSTSAFLHDADPWALHGMTERLHEPVDRGSRPSPTPRLVEQQQAFLEAEGDLES